MPDSHEGLLSGIVGEPARFQTQTILRQSNVVRTMRSRILIADDHEVSRVGIRDILRTDSRWEVCEDAIDGTDAVEKVRRFKPDVVIMDVVMHGVSSAEAVRQIRRISPLTKIIMVSLYDFPQLAMSLGADTFLMKAQCGMYLNHRIADLLGRGS